MELCGRDIRQWLTHAYARVDRRSVGIYDSMHPWLSLLWWRHELASLEFRTVVDLQMMSWFSAVWL